MNPVQNRPKLFLDFDETIFDYRKFLFQFLGLRHEEHISQMRKIQEEGQFPNLKDFLYPDTEHFLTHAREKFDLILVTQAPNHPNYQLKKVLASGIEPYFEHIRVTGIDKFSFIMNDLEHLSSDARKESAFIDDNIGHIRAVREHIPDIKVFLIDRRNKWKNEVIDVPMISAFEDARLLIY